MLHIDKALFYAHFISALYYNVVYLSVNYATA